jgi:Zn-dependent protease
VEQLIIGIPGLLAALVLHEYAHAQVSTWLGDPTPGLEGRLSLNPLVHIDWLGMVMLWVFRFGWARPVQIDPRYYRNPRAGMVLVALAGPVMNVLVALACLAFLAHFPWPRASWSVGAEAILSDAVLYNVFFAVFNILPIPPLDGSRVLSSISREGARLMAAIEPWGWILLIVLVLTSFIGRIVDPLEVGLLRFLTLVAGARVLA